LRIDGGSASASGYAGISDRGDLTGEWSLSADSLVGRAGATHFGGDRVAGEIHLSSDHREGKTARAHGELRAEGLQVAAGATKIKANAVGLSGDIELADGGRMAGTYRIRGDGIVGRASDVELSGGFGARGELSAEGGKRRANIRLEAPELTVQVGAGDGTIFRLHSSSASGFWRSTAGDHGDQGEGGGRVVMRAFDAEAGTTRWRGRGTLSASYGAAAASPGISKRLEAHVRRLRSKLGDGDQSPFLLTVRGQGYRLADRRVARRAVTVDRRTVSRIVAV
jgi:hypothetical protein